MAGRGTGRQKAFEKDERQPVAKKAQVAATSRPDQRAFQPPTTRRQSALPAAKASTGSLSQSRSLKMGRTPVVRFVLKTISKRCVRNVTFPDIPPQSGSVLRAASSEGPSARAN